MRCIKVVCVMKILITEPVHLGLRRSLFWISILLVYNAQFLCYTAWWMAQISSHCDLNVIKFIWLEKKSPLFVFPFAMCSPLDISSYFSVRLWFYQLSSCSARELISYCIVFNFRVICNLWEGDRICLPTWFSLPRHFQVFSN